MVQGSTQPFTPQASLMPRAERARQGLPERAGFRADVEGMRAVAIVVVVLYHAGFPLIRGGYVGVDVFFVLSGFVITMTLSRELARRGTISIAGFYARRAARLLPAATAVIVVTLVASWLWLSPLVIGDIAMDAVASTLYVINYRLAIVGVDYFDTRNVLIAWLPLALAVAAGLGARRAGRAGLVAAGALALLSASTVVFVATSESLQRDNWRGVAEALEKNHSASPRALVITPFTVPPPFAVYAPQWEVMPAEGAAVQEIDYVALPLRRRTQARPGKPPRPENHPAPGPGFELVQKRFDETFTLLRYTSATPVHVTPAGLVGSHIEFERRAAVLLEP